MIQYPKQVHTTLPSVESWGASMNILKDPPKSVWTRQINKVNETSEITRMIGEDNGDRICEMIKVYPRGINPMVSVSYSNYGTNGGQNRNITGAGMFGSNKMARDGRSAYMGQAKLPYPIMKDGDFRPPVWRQEDLLPLSRLPRTNTSAWTSPGFVNFAKGTSCSKPEKLRQVVKDPIRPKVRPTKTITIQQPLVEPFAVRQVIDNPIFTSVVSVKRGADRGEHVNSDVNGRVKDLLEGEININKSAQRQVERMVKDLNPERYTAPVTYSHVLSKSTMHVAQTLKEAKGKNRAIGIAPNISVQSRKTRQGARTLEPSEKGQSHAIQETNNVNVNCARVLPGAGVPRRANKGKLAAVGKKEYTEIRSRRTRQGAQLLEEGKHSKKHTLQIVYSDVTANRSRNVSVPFKEAKHSKSAIQSVLHTSATSGVNIPNAEPIRKRVLQNLEKSLPRHEAIARPTSNAYHKNVEGVHVYPLSRKIPSSSVRPNIGHSGMGVDTYKNQSRAQRIKPTLSINSSFEGRATVPMESQPRKVPTLNNASRHRLLTRARHTCSARG